MIPEVEAILETATTTPEAVIFELPADCEIVNVTIPIQCLIEDKSRLNLFAGSKSDLAGFFDPCFGEEKNLLIRYKYQNKLHQVIIRDDEQLRCPRVSHQLAQ